MPSSLSSPSCSCSFKSEPFYSAFYIFAAPLFLINFTQTYEKAAISSTKINAPSMIGNAGRPLLSPAETPVNAVF
jgi:hypothetical protein